MWIESIRIQNFSSFGDSGWIDLDRSFNLFVGQNNSGKSALLRALKTPMPDNRHKSESAYLPGLLTPPSISIKLRTSIEELYNRAAIFAGDLKLPISSAENDRVEELRKKYLANPQREIVCNIVRSPGGVAGPEGGSSLPEITGNQMSMTITRSRTGQYVPHARVNEYDNVGSIFDHDQTQTIFYFTPQRINVGSYNLVEEKDLKPDASNLPAVLAYLQGSRRPIFNKIVNHLISIMGGVGEITVTPRGNRFVILMWPVKDSDREELAFSLDDSGTGVGQLLAILTAVAIADQSVIVIDEVNTFLHPTAAKKLMALLRTDYSRHQYIISTHSSDVISSANAEKLYLVTREGYDSKATAIDTKDVEGAREVAGALGFSMMDVFGQERMVWVEGRTEEICFPYLAKAAGLTLTPDIGFSSVASTDAFTNRGSSTKSVIGLYDHVASRLSPLLKGMSFGLDRERLSDAAVKGLEDSKRKLRFLPRRCVECYCLDPEAISAVVSDLDSQPVSQEAVSELLNEGAGPEFGAASMWIGVQKGPR